MMLYKVYTFARYEDVIKEKERLPNHEVLRRLFFWVLDTKHFNDPEDVMPLEEKEELPEDPQVQKKFAEFLKPSKFRRHFLPLLSLICEKIPGCTFLIEEPIQQRIFSKFFRFRNFDELKAKVSLLEFIPKELLSKL